MFTGLIENVAGFGLPITIGAPMLTALGVSPVIAVASTAIGHSWSVITSGMALAFRTLTDITGTDPAALFPPTAVLGSIAILLTGLSTAWILKQLKHWRKVILLAVIVSAVFALSGLLGLITISSFIASIVGILAGILLGKKPANWTPNTEKDKHLLGGVLTYGFLIAVIMVATLVKPVNTFLSQYTWTLAFPAVDHHPRARHPRRQRLPLPFSHPPGYIHPVDFALRAVCLPAVQGVSDRQSRGCPHPDGEVRRSCHPRNPVHDRYGHFNGAHRHDPATGARHQPAGRVRSTRSLQHWSASPVHLSLAAIPIPMWCWASCKRKWPRC